MAIHSLKVILQIINHFEKNKCGIFLKVKKNTLFTWSKSRNSKFVKNGYDLSK